MVIIVESYGDRPRKRNWWPDFLKLATDLSASFGWSYTHVTGAAWPGRGAALGRLRVNKYSDRAIGRFTELFARGKSGNAEFIWAGPGRDLLIGPKVDVGFGVAPVPGPPRCNASLMMNPGFVIRDDRRSPEECILAVLKAFDDIMEQKYGLVHLMARAKWPGLYFSGWHTPKLTEEESSDLDRWDDWDTGYRFYRERIWQVFWGNLISAGHGGSRHAALLRSIREQVGEDRVFPLGGDRHFFTLPFDIRDAAEYDENLARWRRRLASVPVVKEALM